MVPVAAASAKAVYKVAITSSESISTLQWENESHKIALWCQFCSILQIMEQQMLVSNTRITSHEGQYFIIDILKIFKKCARGPSYHLDQENVQVSAHLCRSLSLQKIRRD